MKLKHLLLIFMVVLVIGEALSLLSSVPTVNASSTASTSTTNLAIQYGGFQRRTFYAAGRHWVFYASTSILASFTSSIDGSTSWAAGTALGTTGVGGGGFSVFYNGSHVAYARCNTGSNTYIYYRLGIPQTDGSISWVAAETNATSLSSLNNYYNFPCIALDSVGYPWIGYRLYEGLSSHVHAWVTKSAWANGSWSNEASFPYTPTATTDSGEYFVCPVPQTTGTNVYLVYNARTAKTLKGKQWYSSNSSWNVEETATALSIATNMAFSAVNDGSNIYVAFNENGTNYLQSVKRAYATGSWASNVTIQASVTATSSCALTIKVDTSTLYCFWEGSPTANHVYYKTYSSGVWDVAATDWILDNPLTANDELSSSYQAYTNTTNAFVGLVYECNTSSPYNIRYDFLSLGIGVAIGSPTVSWDDTDNVYAQKRDYVVSVTYTDYVGFLDIFYCELLLKTGANVTRAEFAYCQSTNTFSVASGASEWELSGANTSSGNDIALTWNIKACWAATEESDLDLLFFMNATGYSLNSVNDANFDVVTSLVTSNFATNDSHTDINGGVTLTGTVYYANDPASTTSSTSYPPDAEFSFVHIHDAAHNSVGSTGVITNGAFSVSFNIANVVQLNVYHVYLNMADGDYPDADAIDGDTIAVIGDRIIIDTLGTSDTRANIGENVTIYATASLEYGPHTLGAGDSLTLGGEVMTWDPVDSRFEANITFLVVGDQTINSFTSGTEATFVITVGNINAKTETTIWDALMIFNVQPVQYQGSGGLYYQAQIEWVWDSVLISGATCGVAYPNDTAIGSMTSNSTGWLTFIIDQGNATNGNFIIYGINDNNYTITVSGSNKTFTLNAWDLVSQDVDGNTLTGSTIVLTLNSTSIWSGSPRTLYIPSDTFNVSISWLQNLVINTTNNLVLAGDTTTNFNCSCYPFTVSATTYWASSNATIATKTYVSDLLVLTFSGGASPYTLVSSCPTQPTFILNVTYDLLTVFDPYGYLVLPHYGNITLSISYESWSDTYVQSTDRIIISSNLTGYKLYVTMTGTSGDMGILKIYCGLRGNPATTSGFVTTSYMGSTLTGNYVFASDVTGLLDWTSYGSPGGTSDGTSSPPAGLVASIVFGFPPATTQGIELNGFLNITWTTYPSLFLFDVRCDGPYNWHVGIPNGLPLTLNMENGFGKLSLNIVLFIPNNASIGTFTIPFTVVLGTQEATKTIHTVITLTVETPRINIQIPNIFAYMTIPDMLIYAGLASISLVIFGTVFRKRERNS